MNKKYNFPINPEHSCLNETIFAMKMENPEYNALDRNGIDKIYQLLEVWNDLLQYRGIGEKKVTSIHAAFYRYYVQSLSNNEYARFCKRFAELNNGMSCEGLWR